MFEEDTQNASIDAILKKRKSQAGKTEKKSSARLLAKPEPKSSKVPSENIATIVGNSQSFDLTKTMESKRNKKRIRWTIFTIIILALLGAGVWWFANTGHRIFAGRSPLDFLRDIGKLTTADDKPLLGEETGGINILLLGIGGENHEGGTLADTIILATIKPAIGDQEAKVSLLSIPRDFNVHLPDGYEWRKVNSAYAYGELKGSGIGAQWTMDAIEEWTGTDIPYYMVIDFEGFEKAIDQLNGIEVEIENSFTDAEFPDNRYGYLPPLHFEKGIEHMDGERALQFARSRHGNNNEGGDFARAARQRKVLTAVKDKAAKLKLTTDLGTIINLLDTFSRNFKTNMEPSELKRLYSLSSKLDSENIKSLALDYETGLICPEIVEETGASILTLCPGKTKGDVHRFVATRFDETSVTVEEQPIIELQNATKVNFLARTASESLDIPNATITTANFPGSSTPKQTVIHDLSQGTKPNTLDYLKSAFPGNTVISSYPYPDSLPTPKPDFVVVLGTAAAEQFAQ